jgi:hypothetical protein
VTVIGAPGLTVDKVFRTLHHEAIHAIDPKLTNPNFFRNDPNFSKKYRQATKGLSRPDFYLQTDYEFDAHTSTFVQQVINWAQRISPVELQDMIGRFQAWLTDPVPDEFPFQLDDIEAYLANRVVRSKQHFGKPGTDDYAQANDLPITPSNTSTPRRTVRQRFLLRMYQLLQKLKEIQATSNKTTPPATPVQPTNMARTSDDISLNNLLQTLRGGGF